MRCVELTNNWKRCQCAVIIRNQIPTVKLYRHSVQTTIRTILYIYVEVRKYYIVFDAFKCFGQGYIPMHLLISRLSFCRSPFHLIEFDLTKAMRNLVKIDGLSGFCQGSRPPWPINCIMLVGTSLVSIVANIFMVSRMMKIRPHNVRTDNTSKSITNLTTSQQSMFNKKCVFKIVLTQIYNFHSRGLINLFYNILFYNNFLRFVYCLKSAPQSVNALDLSTSLLFSVT